MQESILTSRLTQEERETHFYIEGQKVICDSTEPKYFNKCLRQGWRVISKTVYSDGTICGMVLEAPVKAISIRSAKVVKHNLTDEQRAAIADRLRQSRNRNNN